MVGEGAGPSAGRRHDVAHARGRIAVRPQGADAGVEKVLAQRRSRHGWNNTYVRIKSQTLFLPATERARICLKYLGYWRAGGGTKPATLESGVRVDVPLFVNEGDRVRVDTRSGEYVSRA